MNSRREVRKRCSGVACCCQMSTIDSPNIKEVVRVFVQCMKWVTGATSGAVHAMSGAVPWFRSFEGVRVGSEQVKRRQGHGLNAIKELGH